jgi:hypothetical protein
MPRVALETYGDDIFWETKCLPELFADWMGPDGKFYHPFQLFLSIEPYEELGEDFWRVLLGRQIQWITKSY